MDLIVATDAGAILGIGDWGVGGMSIAVGKLAVYTAAAGIDPGRTLPVMLDVGTDRQSLLDDPHVHRQPASAGAATPSTTRSSPPSSPRSGRSSRDALLHWEDMATANARRLLTQYRIELPTFNDDVQGTGAVNLAAVLAAVEPPASSWPITAS